MTKLSEARQMVTDVLQSADVNIPAYGFQPDRGYPPFAVVFAGGAPYIERGQTFRSTRIRYNVRLVAALGTSEVVTENLDSMIDNAFVAFREEEMDIESVSEPVVYDFGTGTYLTADLAVVFEIEL